MPVAWTFQWIDVPSEAIAEPAAHKVNVGVGFGEVRSNGAWIGRAADGGGDAVYGAHRIKRCRPVPDRGNS